MPDIQIGLDLATSLSVVSAAIAFVCTQLTQGRKSRTQAVRTQRIDYMVKACGELVEIIHQGDEIVSKVRKAQAGREVLLSPDDFTDFCISVERYIRINTTCKYKVWANEQELEILSSLAIVVREWNKRFIVAADARAKGEQYIVPSFDELIEQLICKVESFSTLVRQEIERVDA